MGTFVLLPFRFRKGEVISSLFLVRERGLVDRCHRAVSGRHNDEPASVSGVLDVRGDLSLRDPGEVGELLPGVAHGAVRTHLRGERRDQEQARLSREFAVALNAYLPAVAAIRGVHAASPVHRGQARCETMMAKFRVARRTDQSPAVALRCSVSSRAIRQAGQWSLEMSGGRGEIVLIKSGAPS